MSNNYHRPATVDERLLLMRSKRNNNTRKKASFVSVNLCRRQLIGNAKTELLISCARRSMYHVCRSRESTALWVPPATNGNSKTRNREGFPSDRTLAFTRPRVHTRARALVDNATMHTVIAEDRPIRHTHTQTKSEKSRLTRPLCWGSNDFRSFWWDYKWMGIARTGYSISHSAISAIKKMKQKKKTTTKKNESMFGSRLWDSSQRRLKDWKGFANLCVVCCGQQPRQLSNQELPEVGQLTRIALMTRIYMMPTLAQADNTLTGTQAAALTTMAEMWIDRKEQFCVILSDEKDKHKFSFSVANTHYSFMMFACVLLYHNCDRICQNAIKAMAVYAEWWLALQQNPLGMLFIFA